MSETLVLIVDDEEQIRQGAKVRLQFLGYKTITANDGAQGVVKARTQRPQVILMDVRMPNLDGLGALAELKSDETTSAIPVIMLSASLPDQKKAIDAGASYFIAKPYQSCHLQDAVSAVL